jgi:hypothetical protein
MPMPVPQCGRIIWEFKSWPAGLELGAVSSADSARDSPSEAGIPGRACQHRGGRDTPLALAGPQTGPGHLGPGPGPARGRRARAGTLPVGTATGRLDASATFQLVPVPLSEPQLEFRVRPPPGGRRLQLRRGCPGPCPLPVAAQEPYWRGATEAPVLSATSELLCRASENALTATTSSTVTVGYDAVTG